MRAGCKAMLTSRACWEHVGSMLGAHFVLHRAPHLTLINSGNRAKTHRYYKDITTRKPRWKRNRPFWLSYLHNRIASAVHEGLLHSWLGFRGPVVVPQSTERGWIDCLLNDHTQNTPAPVILLLYYRWQLEMLAASPAHCAMYRHRCRFHNIAVVQFEVLLSLSCYIHRGIDANTVCINVFMKETSLSLHNEFYFRSSRAR